MSMHLSIQSLRRGWKHTRLFFGVLEIVRFSLLIPAVLIATLIVSDQMADYLRALCESAVGVESIALWCACLITGLIVWYSARTLLRFRYARIAASDQRVYPGLKRGLPRLLGPLIPLAFALRIGQLALSATGRAGFWSQIAGLLAVSAILGLFVVERRTLARHAALRFLADPEATETRNLRAYRELPAHSQQLVFALIVLDVALAASAPWTSWAWSGAPAILVFALGLMAITGSVLVYAGNHYDLPVILVMVLWAALWSGLNDNHAVRTAPGQHSHALLARADNPRIPIAADDTLAHRSANEYFRGWWEDLQRRSPGEADIPIVIVTADGGGIRAAYWTAEILAKLEDLTAADPVPFSRRVFAISGVSGGSLGAATFAAIVARRTHLAAGGQPLPDDRVAEASQVLRYDFLSPTLSAMLFPDLLQRFLPLPLVDDRAMALEQSWEGAWHAVHVAEPSNAFAEPFYRLWVGTGYRVPLLYLNGTVVENGERSIVAPLLRSLDSPNDCSLGMAAERPHTDTSDASSEPTDVLDVGNAIGLSMPLSTAALLSARFTYVSPEGLIDTRVKFDRWHRIVDGGYFDNSGAPTAAQLLRIIDPACRQTNGGRQPRLIVLHLVNEPATPRRSEVNLRRYTGGRVWLSELLSPLQALYQTRGAHGVQSENALQSVIWNGARAVAYEVRVQRISTDLPLGWMLSPKARQDMDRELTCCPSAAACPATVLNQLLHEIGSGARLPDLQCPAMP